MTVGPVSLLPLLAALPFLGAAALAAWPGAGRRAAAWLAGVVALAGVAGVMALAPAVFGGEVLRWSVAWMPALGLDLSLRVDGLAWLFMALITLIGALVVLYAAWYLAEDDPAPRFFVFLLLFMGAMLGVVMAGNLIALVIAWELTSLSSFLLIGYWHADRDNGPAARQGARMALTITGAGGLALLAGVLLIGHIVGSFDLDVVLASGSVIRAHPLYEVALVLVLLGAFTKSAQFPFHFWLPHAMAAPTPVSAYLHSATMVKAGVFLLARMYPALGGSEPWFWIVSLTGLATLLLGAYIAIFQHDLKGLLAYSTISHLGLITLLFGLDSPLAVVAGVFHIINHATFKAGLFMSAGIIDHETGTRDMRRINGLWKYMPITGVLGMVAAAAMAGVPLLNGFLSKEMFFAETLAKQGHGPMEWLLPAGATLAGVFSVAYSLRFVHDVWFNGEPVDLPRLPHEPPRFMRLPVELLVVVCLAVGLLPAFFVGPTLAVAAQAAVFGVPGEALPPYTLAIWHGLNLPLAMSVLAVGGGVALYFGLQRFINLHRVVQLPGGLKRGGRELFTALLDGTVHGARALTLSLQNGRLQRYLLLLVGLALAAGAGPFVHAAFTGVGDSQAAPLHLDGLSLPVAVVGGIGIAGAFATVALRHRRLPALLVLGATGLVVALTFVHLSAPDLALTQLLVEMVTLILMMLALNHLPREGAPEPGRSRAVRDAVIATAAGLGIAAIVWMVLTRPFDSISPYFLETTRSLGGGANAVNVIIVDYRGFDTLGEITVLGIAALIIHALLADFRPAFTPVPGSAAQRHPLMLQLISRLLLPFAVLVAVHLFLRGHNLPGGGFIAGLVLAMALLLQYVAHGSAWVGQRWGGDFRPWMGWGLLIAGGTGVASAFFGAPFLTSTYDYPVWPIVGEVPLASASMFDLGVFLVVVGATMVALLSIARTTSPVAAREAN
jgi:multicomponent K+:H+ antiporter subunit A